MIAVQEKVLKPLIFICLKIVPDMPLAKDESKERWRNASPINRKQGLLEKKSKCSLSKVTSQVLKMAWFKVHVC